MTTRFLTDLPEESGEMGFAEMKAARARFDALLAISSELQTSGHERAAFAAAELAAFCGAYDHHGDFRSDALENLVASMSGPGGDATPIQRSATPSYRRILHVLTAAKDVGGDTRFVTRWIERDASRTYSVAMTTQGTHPVPDGLLRAVASSGGRVLSLDAASDSPFSRAAGLRNAATEHDLVFLHVYVEDLIPVLAFTKRALGIPIVLVAQADHQFFSGLSCSDFIVHMRESGAALSLARRSVAKSMFSFLPIPLQPVQQDLDRRQARSRLGIDDSTVLLLSIARDVKFRSISGPSFLDAALHLTSASPNVRVLVVGPHQRGAWLAAHEQSGGRVVAVGPQVSTSSHYAAADIYLDSFPFSSNTSLLEAGIHGLPLVSFFPHADDAVVMGPGAPGLTRSLVIARNFEEYLGRVHGLVDDAGDREELGQQTRGDILRFHCGDGWLESLERLFGSLQTPKHCSGASSSAGRSPGALDLCLRRLYADVEPFGHLATRYARCLPYRERMALLRRLIRVSTDFSFGLFLPRGMDRALSPLFRGWRNSRLMSRLRARKEPA